VDGARLLVLAAAQQLDLQGNKGARGAIAVAKVREKERGALSCPGLPPGCLPVCRVVPEGTRADAAHTQPVSLLAGCSSAVGGCALVHAAQRYTARHLARGTRQHATVCLFNAPPPSLCSTAPSTPQPTRH
jgi:hypothetical protein